MPATALPGFRSARSVIADAERLAWANDVAGLLAHAPTVTREGVALLRAPLPHDLARPDVPRFLEGRAAFGAALLDWGRASDARDGAALLRALPPLVDAFWGWVDAWRGLPPERSV
jgi:hypothetical protein